jgi:hypothetical protein
MIILENTDPQFRNIPVSLTPKLVENPYAVLEWFFYPTDVIPKYRIWMALWLMDAIGSPVKPKRRHLLKAFYNFSHMAKLLDALWIIYKQGDRFTREDTAVRGDLDSYDIIWSERVHDHMRFENYAQTDFFPELLDVEDEKDPFAVIADFFSHHDLFDAKAKLERWLMSILAGKGQDDHDEKERLHDFYVQMVRVLEAVFIIVEVRLLKESRSIF